MPSSPGTEFPRLQVRGAFSVALKSRRDDLFIDQRAPLPFFFLFFSGAGWHASKSRHLLPAPLKNNKSWGVRWLPFYKQVIPTGFRNGTLQRQTSARAVVKGTALPELNRWRFVRLVAVVLATILGTSGASGQLQQLKNAAGVKPSLPATEAAPTNSVETKLAEARARLSTANDAALTNAPVGVSPQEVATRRVLLYRLVALLEQHMSNTGELDLVRQRRAEAEREARSWSRFAEPPPYSVILTDRLREDLQAEQLKNSTATAAAATLDQLVAENRAALTRSEETIRQLNEQLESSKDSAAMTRLSWQRDLERLRSQVAAASVGSLESERRLRQELASESRLRVDLLQRQLLMAESDVSFTQSDLDKVLGRIEEERRDLEAEAVEAATRRLSALQAVELAREELRLAQASAGTPAAQKDLAAETLAARQAQLETADASVRVLRLMLESEGIERAMWDLRFTGFDSHNVATLTESEHRLETFARRLELWRQYQEQQLETAPTQIEVQQSRIRDLSSDSPLLPAARERLAALRERDQLLLRLVRRIEQVQRLGQRWQEGIQVAEHRLPLMGRVQNLFSDAGSFLKKLWRLELFTAEDTITVEGQKITGRRGVTLGKVLMAVLILTIGIWLSRLFSRLMQPIIIRRFHIEPNEANLIRRWFHAFMVLCIVMFSLVSVKIPLTVFAFAGGALAIGLGFGMQTLLKNFVSGLILLFERPFRVGDVLEVSRQRGMVTEIGLRSSVLALWDGTETLIPNSYLLENAVSNWTYSSRNVRFTIAVGVAYGSDTRRAIQLLTEVAERHGVVEKEPKPQAYLTEFGDNALLLELRFWVDVIKSNAALVSSDLRQMIAGAFAENNIVIAFPQRDLHVDAARPIPVEIVPPSDARNAVHSQDQPSIPGVLKK